MSDAPAESMVDTYQLVNCIARSGTSQIWEVTEQGSGRHLAMKRLIPTSPEFAEAKASLKHEAGVCKQLDHPSIVKFEKYVASRANTYMLMEYFRAANVKQQLKTDLIGVQARAKRLFEGVCLALAHMHQKGWVHRDMKPDNLLFNKASEVRLIDFSLSVRASGGLGKLLGKKKAIQGTRTYIAPETIRKQAATPRTDMYSLGVTLFEVLTGRTPFQGFTPDELLKKHLSVEPPPPSEFNNNVTPEMDRLVLKLLEKKPAKRYGDMNEVYGDIRRLPFYKVEIDLAAAAQAAEAEEKRLKDMLGQRLDSRSDATRTQLRKENPEFAKMEAEAAAKAPKKKPKPTPAAVKAARPAAQPQQPPMPAGYPPGQVYPGYPQPYPPGAMPVPQPGYPAGMPYPQGYPMYAAMPGVPGYAPQMPPPGYPPGAYPMQPPPGAPPATPPQGQPGRPAPAARPAGAAPQAAAPPKPKAPQPATAQPGNPPPPPKPAADQDLPLMTDLPEIL